MSNITRNQEPISAAAIDWRLEKPLRKQQPPETFPHCMSILNLLTSTSNLFPLQNKQLKNDDFYETYLKSFGNATLLHLSASRFLLRWKVRALIYTVSPVLMT